MKACAKSRLIYPHTIPFHSDNLHHTCSEPNQGIHRSSIGKSFMKVALDYEDLYLNQHRHRPVR